MAKLDSYFLFACIFGLLLGLLANQYQPWDSIRHVGFSLSSRCESPTYQVRIVSFDPLILHLENFITPAERRRMMTYANADRLKKSLTVNRNGTSELSDYRTSSSGVMPRNDSAAKCVIERMASFQGFVNSTNFEGLQLTYYKEGAQFKPHLDWGNNATMKGPERFRRATTGFGILDADCENCGTQFTRLTTNWTNASPEWCRIVECNETLLTVKPLPGSVLFWQNVRSDGLVDRRMRHAGLPVENGGHKLGLNIWTTVDLWEMPVDQGIVLMPRAQQPTPDGASSTEQQVMSDKA